MLACHSPTHSLHCHSQVYKAFAACKKEFYKLYKSVYEGHMLYLWLWNPDYSRAAARGLCSVINVPGSAAPDPHDAKEQWMVKQFQNDADVIRKLWAQYRLTEAEVADIVQMSHTNNGGKTQEYMSTTYPHYDYLLFIKYAALCTANHYIEGSFSNIKSLHRINMSDARLDRDARYKQNIEYNIKKDVIEQAKARRATKGCSTNIR